MRIAALVCVALLFGLGCTRPVQWRYASPSPTNTCVQACQGNEDCYKNCPGIEKTRMKSCRPPDVVGSPEEARLVALDRCLDDEETNWLKTGLWIGAITFVVVFPLWAIAQYRGSDRH